MSHVGSPEVRSRSSSDACPPGRLLHGHARPKLATDDTYSAIRAAETYRGRHATVAEANMTARGGWGPIITPL